MTEVHGHGVYHHLRGRGRGHRSGTGRKTARCLVNAVPCSSTYRWDGTVRTDDDEVILLAKTTSDGTDVLAGRVEKLHPYGAPCIEVFEERSPLPSFAQWHAESAE